MLIKPPPISPCALSLAPFSKLKMHLQWRCTFLFLILLISGHVWVSAQPTESPTLSDFNTRMTPSMTIIIVVIIVALFFMGFFSLYIRHCGDPTNSQLPTRGILLNRGSRRPGRRGLDQALIEKFPTLMYSEVIEHKIGKGALECAVCLNEFEDDETLRLIPKCDHVFHKDCIDPWLASHTTCPVCRSNLEESEAPPSSGPVEQSIAIPDSEEGETGTTTEPALTRSSTRGSVPSRLWYPRSHSTGHSLVQPTENTDRFTLRLPEDVRKRIIGRQLERSMSLVVLPRERSWRRGFRAGGADVSGRWKPPRPPVKSGDSGEKSGRWVFSRNQSFLARASSFLARSSNKVGARDGEGTSDSVKPGSTEPGCLPV